MNENQFFFSFHSDLDESISSLQDFSTELVVESVASCLAVITGNEIPYKLPPSMSAKFRVCSNLASVLQVTYRHLSALFHIFFLFFEFRKLVTKMKSAIKLFSIQTSMKYEKFSFFSSKNFQRTHHLLLLTNLLVQNRIYQQNRQNNKSQIYNSGLF